jgi:hypothetical protein
MTTSIVICRILLSADQKFGVEELTVIAGADFINWGGIEVNKDGARDIFAFAGFCEEGLKGTSLADVFCFGVGATISLKAMLEEITCNL